MQPPLTWPVLRVHLYDSFRPADFERFARSKLHATRQKNADVTEYIAEFRHNFNRCANVSEPEALFVFE